ncbi:hypothetical protein D1007_10325 [Hordeum vulgare]|nr:hypothetical protein D1007_10325 [Hordeum vulgare]
MKRGRPGGFNSSAQRCSKASSGGRRAVCFICRGSFPSPLVPDEAGYLDFFTKVVERLEGGAQEVEALIEEGSRDRLSQVLTCSFCNLFHTDPSFNLEAMMALVPEASCGALWKVVKDHVDALSAQFTPDRFQGHGVPRDTQSMKAVMKPKHMGLTTTAMRIARTSRPP